MLFRGFLLDKMAFSMHNILNREDNDKSMPEQGKFPPFTENPANTGLDSPVMPKDIWQTSWY